LAHDDDDGYVTTAATVDKDTMRLITSIPWESGVVITNLTTSEQKNIQIRELGVVEKIALKMVNL